jgi:hypothetical protein
MPALLWVTFWSSLLASAACWGTIPEQKSAQSPPVRD